jgi:hypothetical protein
MTNYSAGVSGNGNRIKSKMAAKYRDKRTSITTVQDQYPSYDIFPTPPLFFITHYLKDCFKQIGAKNRLEKFSVSFNPMLASHLFELQVLNTHSQIIL